jgi:hypothetical protein
VIAWSQGNLDTQWALKYWPSTRELVRDFIGISPDFHGTTNVGQCLELFPILGGCPPALLQQNYTSNFVETLRSHGGDSAYVPTTTIFSTTDQVVMPQEGFNASAIIRDARRVGVTNAEIQFYCDDKPAGGNVTHEGVLYNPLAFGLAVDALTHQGPGKVHRLPLEFICQQEASLGLNANDIALTEGMFE